VNGRGLLDGLVHRQIADVVLVDREPHLLLERQGVELARGREGRVHHRVRHAVPGEVEEGDGLAGVPHLGGEGLEGARLTGIRPESR